VNLSDKAAAAEHGEKQKGSSANKNRQLEKDRTVDLTLVDSHAKESQRQLQRAEKALELALSLQPSHTSDWFVLGTVRMRLAHLADAKAKTEAAGGQSGIGGASSSSSSAARAASAASSAEGVRLRWQGALTAFSTVVAHEPDEGDAWGNVGAIHMHLKKFDLACAAFTEGLKASRENWRMWENRLISTLQVGVCLVWCCQAVLSDVCLCGCKVRVVRVVSCAFFFLVCVVLFIFTIAISITPLLVFLLILYHHHHPYSPNHHPHPPNHHRHSPHHHHSKAKPASGSEAHYAGDAVYSALQLVELNRRGIGRGVDTPMLAAVVRYCGQVEGTAVAAAVMTVWVWVVCRMFIAFVVCATRSSLLFIPPPSSSPPPPLLHLLLIFFSSLCYAPSAPSLKPKAAARPTRLPLQPRSAA
jgi:tetratricopeptide (TPR) repeat protein